MLSLSTDRANIINLGLTQITNRIIVLSYAIFRSECYGSFWQIETYVASKDWRLRNIHICHGSPAANIGEPPARPVYEDARKVHGYISANLQKRFATA